MDIRNHEGYIDEVPWQAIRNVEREAVERLPFLPLVYICAPYSGDVAKNTRKAAEFAAFAYRRGNIPITPHLLFPFLDDENPDERKLALHMDLVLYILPLHHAFQHGGESPRKTGLPAAAGCHLGRIRGGVPVSGADDGHRLFR